MKNKKTNIGKIALLTAAMAVTVPTAFALSACGGSKSEEGDKEDLTGHVAETAWQADDYNHWHGCSANDDHKYDANVHTWKINNETFTCTVCDYTKTEKGENDTIIRKLQANWEKLANYQGGLILTSQSSGVNEDGTVYTSKMAFSYEPTEGIFYDTYEMDGYSMVEKIVKDGDRYVACTISQSAEEEADYNYTSVVDNKYLTNILLPNTGFDPKLESFAGVDLKALFTKTYTSATFAERFMTLASASLGVELDEDKSTIDYAVEDGILTVTARAQTIEQDGQYVISTLVFKSDNATVGRFKSIVAQMDTVTEVDGETQTTTSIMSQTYGFDRDGYNEIDVGEIPEDELAVETVPVKVMFRYGRQGVEGTADDSVEIEVPYQAFIRGADSVHDYDEQLKAKIAECLSVDVSKVSINRWTTDDYVTEYYNEYFFVTSNDHVLYANIHIAE